MGLAAAQTGFIAILISRTRPAGVGPNHGMP